MLGSVADAEDVVQDAFIRWLGTDRAAVEEPEAFLRRIVTRLCLDVLKSARNGARSISGRGCRSRSSRRRGRDRRRHPAADDGAGTAVAAGARRVPAARRVRRRLRGDRGNAIGRDAAACRQLASRARAHVRAERPRFDVPKERGLEIAEAFFAASRSGDMSALQALLAADVAMYSDGGGKRPALRAMFGLEDVMRLHASLAQLFARSSRVSATAYQRPARLREREADGCCRPRPCRSKTAGSRHLHHAQPRQARASDG